MPKDERDAGPVPPPGLRMSGFSPSFGGAADSLGLDGLFDHLPDVYFFVKDAGGRFVRCNAAFLNLVGRAREEDVLGGRDLDFFPPSLAENYMNDDRVVLLSGK